jgi:hypothetical protein
MPISPPFPKTPQRPSSARSVRPTRWFWLLLIIGLISALGCMNIRVVFRVMHQPDREDEIVLALAQYLDEKYLSTATMLEAERALDYAAAKKTTKPLFPLRFQDLPGQWRVTDPASLQKQGFQVKQEDKGFLATIVYTLAQWQKRQANSSQQALQIIQDEADVIRYIFDFELPDLSTSYNVEGLDKLRAEGVGKKPGLDLIDPDKIEEQQGMLAAVIAEGIKLAGVEATQLDSWYVARLLLEAGTPSFTFVVELPGEIVAHTVGDQPAGEVNGSEVTVTIDEAFLRQVGPGKHQLHIESVLDVRAKPLEAHIRIAPDPPAPYEKITFSAEVKGKLEDEKLTYQWLLDGRALCEAATCAVDELAAGAHTVLLVVKGERNDRETSQTRTFTVAVPVASSSAAEAGFTISNPACNSGITSDETLNCTATIVRGREEVESLDIVWFIDGASIEGGSTSGSAVSWTLQQPPPGDHSIQVRATDSKTGRSRTGATGVSVTAGANATIPPWAQAAAAAGTLAAVSTWLWAEWWLSRRAAQQAGALPTETQPATADTQELINALEKLAQTQREINGLEQEMDLHQRAYQRDKTKWDMEIRCQVSDAWFESADLLLMLRDLAAGQADEEVMESFLKKLGAESAKAYSKDFVKGLLKDWARRQLTGMLDKPLTPEDAQKLVAEPLGVVEQGDDGKWSFRLPGGAGKEAIKQIIEIAPLPTQVLKDLVDSNPALGAGRKVISTLYDFFEHGYSASKEWQQHGVKKDLLWTEMRGHYGDYTKVKVDHFTASARRDRLMGEIRDLTSCRQGAGR